ncbi:MAG: hypothetical protein HYW23_00650 [Candidatus Aenigmarchaeota archaeon]|nr:hypothetical protein [Candidatus Aenigmarchaeota archaeon]
MSQVEILEYLKKFGKGTIKDFIKSTGKSRNAIAVSVMKLKRHNEIKRVGWLIVSGIKFALYSINDGKLKLL